MAKIWLKKSDNEPALTIEAKGRSELTQIIAFFLGETELKTTIKRFEYHGNAILEIKKEVTP